MAEAADRRFVRDGIEVERRNAKKIELRPHFCTRVSKQEEMLYYDCLTLNIKCVREKLIEGRKRK